MTRFGATAYSTSLDVEVAAKTSSTYRDPDPGPGPPGPPLGGAAHETIIISAVNAAIAPRTVRGSADMANNVTHAGRPVNNAEGLLAASRTSGSAVQHLGTRNHAREGQSQEMATVWNAMRPSRTTKLSVPMRTPSAVQQTWR